MKRILFIVIALVGMGLWIPRLWAESDAGQLSVAEKCDQIMKSQNEILKEIKEMRNDLRVLRIRTARA